MNGNKVFLFHFYVDEISIMHFMQNWIEKFTDDKSKLV